MEEPQYHLDHVVRAKAEHMEDFDGPLDVILLLLSKNKIEIQDISISSILEQYLAYLDEMKRLDMEIASEFIAMASHLMLIKTKMLLSAAEQQEAISEMELLIRSLEERQRQDAMNQIRTSVAFLSQRNEIGCGLFTKDPEPLRRDNTYRYRHDPEDLVRTMAILADRSQRALPPPSASFSGIVGREPYPRRFHLPKALPRQPFPLRDRGHLFSHPGALPPAFRHAGEHCAGGGSFRAIYQAAGRQPGRRGRAWSRMIPSGR